VPAAVGMKRLAPDRMVIAITGDGDFLMTGQEFATAVQYELPVIILVADNGMYGTIRMHQERHYPGRVVATTLRNPDFAAYARAFGGYGATVEKTADFLPPLCGGRKPQIFSRPPMRRKNPANRQSCTSKSIQRHSRLRCRSMPSARRRKPTV